MTTSLRSEPPFISSTSISSPSSQRLSALYACTSIQRTTNTTGYDANVLWWAGIIEETLRIGWLNGENGDRLLIRIDESLLGKLEDGNGGRPRGIGGFVETLVNTSPATLHPYQQYISSLTPLHAAPSLTSRFIGKPLYWAISQLNPFGSSTDQVEKEETLWNRYGKGKEYVHIPLLQKSADAFKLYISQNPSLSYTESLFDIDSFLITFGQACFPPPTSSSVAKVTSSSGASSKLNKEESPKHSLSRRDVQILVKWLSRDCGLVVTDGTIVKVLDADQIPSDHPITEADRGAVSVLNALNKVDKQMEGIDDQIHQCQVKAKKHLALGQKTIALSYLRSKKQLEDLLAKRVGSAEQLRAVIRSINQAKGDVEILAAYETSTKTLSSVLSRASLSPDRIAQTTDALAEAMANQEEIDEAVRVGGEVAMGNKRVEVDDEDLNDELEEMVREEKEKEKEKREEARRKLEEITREERERVLAEKENERLEVEKEAVQVEKSNSTQSSLNTNTNTSTNSTLPEKVESGKQKDETGEDEWQKRYEDAQARKTAEAKRAEEERLLKDARRMAAE